MKRLVFVLLLAVAFLTAVAEPARGNPDVRFGVLSDVHLGREGLHDEKTLITALEYFRDHDVDAVMISGDIAHHGRISELRRCADAWYRVFPNDRAPDGRHVEKLFVYGNHEIWGTYDWIRENPDEAKLDSIAWDDETIRKTWEDVFHERYSDFWIKKVKGFTFVGGHWTKKDQFDGLEAFLASHAAEIDPDKPFFYTQHSHPKDTCIGAWAWGRDNGVSTCVLSKYPNAVAFSGHSHYPLTDERSVWQGAFTSINTSSLSHSSVGYSLRENVGGNTHGFRGEGREHLMPRIDVEGVKQGLLVSVYGSTVVLERRDFVAATSLGEDWTLSVPCKGDCSFAARARARKAPEFAPDAKLSVIEEQGLFKLSFPAARTVEKCRVFEYEVTVTLVEDEVDLIQVQRRVMAPDYFRPESPEGLPGSCVIARKELPIRGHLRFSVRPLDCFGCKGRPLELDKL